MKVNCSTIKSLPFPFLTWYINSQVVKETGDLFTFQTDLFTDRRKDGLIDSHLQLIVKLRRKHFKVSQPSDFH